MAKLLRSSSPICAVFFLFYLFSSALAASAVLGVDLGTEYIKAALVKPGIPLEIVLTKDSRRKEASTIAFKPAKNIKAGEFPERLYGSDAVALAARFPGDVYPNLKPLLGLRTDNSLVQEYAARHPALKLEAEKTRGTAAFRSGAFAPEEEAWAVEELLAMELQSIAKNAEALAGKGSSVKDLVISVPVFYSQEEKRAVRLAAELAGLRVLELISDSLAVGLNYATTRTFQSVNDGAKAEYHMVFDMGAGSAKASILKFQGRTVKDVGKFNKTIQEVYVLGSGWDRTLGGDALNAVIVDDMISKFVESPAAKSVEPTVEKVKAHGRAVAKLSKEAERLRHILSANTNTQASFEGLYEDVDFRYKISRADFEKFTEAHKERVKTVMQKALDMAELEVSDIDSIILHGGAIRTPFIQKTLEEFIGDAEKVRTNVNSDESAVLGAGFRGAALSPSFRVKDIKSYEGTTYPGGVKWINIYEKPQHIRLWHATSYLGAEKQYSFKNQIDPFKLKFYQHVGSSENVSPGSAEKELVTLTTTNLNESVATLKSKFGCTDGDINVRLSTRLSPIDGEVEIVKFVLDCEVDVVEKESMVDKAKGFLGFGKKDQVPLGEDAEGSSSESGSSSSTSTSTSTSSSSSSSSSSGSASASPSAKDAKAKGEKEAPAKPTKRLEVIELKYTLEIRGISSLPADEIIRMKERIEAFDESDRSRRLREEALNQLEGFTYKVRDLLEKEDFIAASTKEERETLETISKAASDWIYSGGHDAARSELKSKLKEMRDIVGPIEIRRDEAATRPEAIKSLQEALNQTMMVIEGIREQIANETKAHASFSSSKSAAAAASSASATATATASATVDDFEGLEDDAATTTSDTVWEEETMAPMVYNEGDLTHPQALYESTTSWLKEKLALQEKLGPTDDPVILTKDLELKAKTLTDIHVDLIMKSMRQPYKSSRPPIKKTKKSKSKKGKKGTKTEVIKPGKTLGVNDDGKIELKLGEDGQVPSEEEILNFIKSQEGKDFLDSDEIKEFIRMREEKEKEEKAEAKAGGKVDVDGEKVKLEFKEPKKKEKDEL